MIDEVFKGVIGDGMRQLRVDNFGYRSDRQFKFKIMTDLFFEGVKDSAFPVFAIE